MSRTFVVEQHCVEYKTVTWRVEADSHEEAESMVYDGMAEWWDSDEYDTEYGDVTEVRCYDCDATDSDDCECESEDVFADLGL